MTRSTFNFLRQRESHCRHVYGHLCREGRRSQAPALMTGAYRPAGIVFTIHGTPNRSTRLP